MYDFSWKANISTSKNKVTNIHMHTTIHHSHEGNRLTKQKQVTIATSMEQSKWQQLCYGPKQNGANNQSI